MKENKIKVFIVGVGAIGTSIATSLSHDGFEVTVIDTDSEKINNITNSADVIGYQGNGASYDTLKELGAAEADVLIAVTNSDEINILSCYTAHAIGARHTIARIRDVDYANQSRFYKKQMGISMIINPDLASAMEIARILRFPQATRVELFAGGRAELVELNVQEYSPLVGHSLMEIRQNMNINLLVCTIVRDGQAFVPKGNDIIRARDVIYLTGDAREFRDSFKKLGMSVKPLKNVMIAGDDRTTYYLGDLLGKGGINATIIDQDKKVCRDFSDKLPKASIMNDDALRYFDTMSESDIKNTDAYVAISTDDEYNLIGAMFAETQGIGKVIAKVAAKSRLKVLPKETRITTLSREDVAADRILGYTRALLNVDDNDAVESLYRLVDGQLEFIEINVDEQDANLNLPLKQLKIKRNVLLAGLIREGRMIIPNGDDVLKPNDVALIASVGQQIARLEDIYE